MILIADGGSTKVDWALIDKESVVQSVKTKGANPFFRTSEDIASELKESLLPKIAKYEITSVHFFGAGCANQEKNTLIRIAIKDSIGVENIDVGSDLLGAAKALCGCETGIACILGTGSNSGFYDGSKIVENVSPLGFILGDEGSGAVLGKIFVGACLKNQFSPGIKVAFLNEFQLTTSQIIEKVYREPLPNRFLAGFAPFLKKHLHETEIYDLVACSFEMFFKRNVMQYDYRNHPIHFTGSVAHHFEVVLRDVADRLQLQIGKINASPMEGLVEYYSE